MKMVHTVFVYGSLMKGHGNNHLLENSLHLSNAVSVDAYKFYSFGCYPAIKMSAENKNVWRVVGELYQVDDYTLTRLDQLESNGRLYQRHERPVRFTDGGVVTAWVYEYLRHPGNHADEPGKTKHFVTFEDCAFWVGRDEPIDIFNW
jgi:gamma-glutamylcyclotransferase (GGCT)/AIG2-like uncharacterized protein YtfP